MPTFHPLLSDWLRTHHGVVSRSQLIALGLSRSALAAMIRCGELVVVYEGVYRHAMWPNTFLSRCAAVCATHPSVVVMPASNE